MSNIVSTRQIEGLIQLIRGHKVMLDADLADLYGVETRVLVQAVKRNSTRFPVDSMFQLSVEEAEFLRSQSVISKKRRGRRRYLRYFLTEQGVLMLLSVLNRERAIGIYFPVMRAFFRLRQMIVSYLYFHGYWLRSSFGGSED